MIQVELAAIAEIIMIDTTIVDQAQDTQIAVTQDSIHHTTEIIIIVTTIIIDKNLIVKTQTEVTDTDNDQVVIIDIIQTIIKEMIEEVHCKENKMTDITPKIEEQMEINITITIKTEKIA